MRQIYSVYCPPLEITSGGIRVMWGLLGHLLAKGEVALPNINEPGGDFTAIYPEIVRGNPLGAKRSVRYILQTPGVMAHYGESSPLTNEFKNNPMYKEDKIYIFSKVYDTFGVDGDHILFLPIINTKVFKVTNTGKRDKTAFLVGKGFMGDKHPQDSIEITREFARDQQSLADLLNECEVIYVYDRLSAIMEIARLCGTRVEYYGELPEEQLKLYEPGLNGVGYHGTEEKLDVGAFKEHYEAMKETFSKRLDYFIQDTQL